MKTTRLALVLLALALTAACGGADPVGPSAENVRPANAGFVGSGGG